MKCIATDDCTRLPFSVLTPYLSVGRRASLYWPDSGNRIAYQVLGNDKPTAIRLIYIIRLPLDGEITSLDYQVHLTTTPLPWGGVRYWFTCPGPGCEKRISILYRPPGEDIFACRHCYHLSYRSKQEGYLQYGFLTGIASMLKEYAKG